MALFGSIGSAFGGGGGGRVPLSAMGGNRGGIAAGSHFAQPGQPAPYGGGIAAGSRFAPPGQPAPYGGGIAAGSHFAAPGQPAYGGGIAAGSRFPQSGMTPLSALAGGAGGGFGFGGGGGGGAAPPLGYDPQIARMPPVAGVPTTGPSYDDYVRGQLGLPPLSPQGGTMQGMLAPGGTGLDTYQNPLYGGGSAAGTGAAGQFTSDPALDPYRQAAIAGNAAINAANPEGADHSQSFYQGTDPGGGYIAGVGQTLAPGRSVTQADADQAVAAVKGLGASDEWIRDFLQRNPYDYSRLSNVWHDEFSGGMGDSNDPRTAGQFLAGGTPPGAPPVAAPGYQPGGGAPGVPYGNDMYNNPDFGAGAWMDPSLPMPPPGWTPPKVIWGATAPGQAGTPPDLPPWLYGAPPGGGMRPQVQDQYGRSPSNPNYGRPPAPGEQVDNPGGRGPQTPYGAGGMISISDLIAQLTQGRGYTPPGLRAYPT